MRAKTCRRCRGRFQTTTDPEGFFCIPCERELEARAKRLARFWCNLSALGRVIAQTGLVLLVGAVCGAFLIWTDGLNGRIW
jgi:hypothetical protein